MELIKWRIYEVSSHESINGVMLRGRIRKLGIEGGFNVLAENAEDISNGLRFAVIEESDAGKVIDYLHKILSSVEVQHIMDDVENPILSKIKVNIAERYNLQFFPKRIHQPQLSVTAEIVTQVPIYTIAQPRNVLNYAERAVNSALSVYLVKSDEVRINNEKNRSNEAFLA